MTYAPQTSKDAMAFWVAHGGANGGIVGDAAHAARATYHNGWDRAVTRLGTTDMAVVASKDYTYAQKRDQVKSDAAMGIDLSWPLAAKGPLYRFSNWLVEQCKAGACPDIREVIWSPDGKVVKHWNDPYKRVYDGYPIQTGHGDSSHLWHTHISFYRDSEQRAKVGLFAPYFTPTEVLEPMLSLWPPETVEYAKSLKLAPGYELYRNPSKTSERLVLDDDKSGGTFRAVGAVTNWRCVEYVFPADWKKPDGTLYTELAGKPLGIWVPAASVLAEIDNPKVPAPADTSPFTQAQVDVLTKQAASAAAAAVAQAGIGALTTAAGKYP
jgi:hypothetical protein